MYKQGHFYCGTDLEDHIIHLLNLNLKNKFHLCWPQIYYKSGEGSKLCLWDLFVFCYVVLRYGLLQSRMANV